MKRRGSRGGGGVLGFLVLAFVAGVYVDQAFPDWLPYFGHRSVSNVDLAELQQAIRVVQADYVDGNINTTKLSHGTVQGLIAALNDPFSSYYDPEQYKKLKQRYERSYSGIGIYLTFTKDYPVITGTLAGSAAAKAELQAGGQIVQGGDKDLKGITPDQAPPVSPGPDRTQGRVEISPA